jgi:outer membrane lipoprotein-sorting protein
LKSLFCAFFYLQFSIVCAETPSLKDLSRYLSSLERVSGFFVQENADGSEAEGKIFLRKPGRMRMEYTAPANALIVAGGSQIAIFDPKSNTFPRRFPLGKTPLGFILKKEINLERSGLVVSHSEFELTTEIILQDINLSDSENIKLVFYNNPLRIKEWVITNESDEKTRISLFDLEYDSDSSTRKFSIDYEIKKRGLE